MPAKRYSSFVLLGVTLMVGCSETQVEPPAAEAAESVVSSATVYRDFTLIDGTDRAPAAGSAMVVDEGRVSWVGSVNDLESIPGATVVDLNGKYVMPGLIDLHVHVAVLEDFTLTHDAFTMENLRAELGVHASYGVTTVMAQGTEKDLVFDLIDEQRSGIPREARIYTAGQGLMYEDGYGGVDGINQPVATVDDVVRAVEEQSEKGVDIIKMWVDDEYGTIPVMPPEMTQAAIDTAHREGLRILAHIFRLEDAKRLAEQGIDGFVHAVRDAAVDDELIDLMLQNGTWQTASTLSREDAMFAYAERAPFLDDPFFLRSVSPDVVEQLASPEHHANVRAGGQFENYPVYLDYALSNQQAVVEAGVRYAFGTDAGPPGRFPGFSAHWELELMVESGMTPGQAIQAATGHAGEFLGEDVGTLVMSNWADFIVLNADPTQDIRNTQEIESVYIAGRLVYDENTD